MKKIILAIVLISISVTIATYHAEALQFAKDLERESAAMPLVAALVLVGLKTIAAPLGFPGTPLTLITGSLFGNLAGTIVALIGNTLGAGVAFLLSRYLLQDYVQRKLLSKYTKIQSYEKKLEQKPLPTVIALRLIPLFPFNILNFLLGVTRIPFKTYMLGSFVGMIPGTFLFVYFGESLRMLNSVNIILAIFGIIILTWLGKKYEKRF